MVFKVTGCITIGNENMFTTMNMYGKVGSRIRVEAAKSLTAYSVLRFNDAKELADKIINEKSRPARSNRKNTSKYNVVIENNKVFVNENWKGGSKVQAAIDGDTRSIIQAGLVVKKKSPKELMEMFKNKMK